MSTPNELQKSVTFSIHPHFYAIPRRPHNRKSTLNMVKKVYERFADDEVTDEMLHQAAQLFSQNYGVWGEHAEEVMGKFAKAGTRVRLGKDRLRKEYLLKGISAYVRVSVDGNLAGNAFACRWTVAGMTVCWITQLVVHREYRERGLATGLLNEIMLDGDDAYGIMSSHPAACLAASKAFRSSMSTISLEFMKDQAISIMKASPVAYVRNAKLRGSLFDPHDSHGLVACVDTGFFVDHEEPLQALDWVKESMDWPLGDLPDGHEFIFILEAKRRPRYRSRSLGRNNS